MQTSTAVPKPNSKQHFYTSCATTSNQSCTLLCPLPPPPATATSPSSAGLSHARQTCRVLYSTPPHLSLLRRPVHALLRSRGVPRRRPVPAHHVRVWRSCRELCCRGGGPRLESRRGGGTQPQGVLSALVAPQELDEVVEEGDDGVESSGAELALVPVLVSCFGRGRRGCEVLHRGLIRFAQLARCRCGVRRRKRGRVDSDTATTTTSVTMSKVKGNMPD